jgi:hypothetical protein
MTKPFPFKDLFFFSYLLWQRGQPHLGSRLPEYSLEFQKFKTPESALVAFASGLSGLESKF